MNTARLKETLDTIRRRLNGMRGAVATFLIGCFAILMAGTWAFVELASDMIEGDTRAFDEAVLRWVNARATDRFDALALEITVLGDVAVIGVIIMVASALLWVSRHRYSVLLLWIGVAGSGPLIYVLKNLFGRERPQLFEWRGNYMVESASFPSGHALGSVVAYALLAYILVRLEASRPLRYMTFTVALVLIVMIGFTRIYLGVHYPSDVLAGYALGLAWVTLCAVALEAIRYYRTGRLWMSPEEASEEDV